MSDKAILFGINRYAHISDLRGCINDVNNVKSLLVDRFAFSADNIRTRTDDKVTKKEITKQWEWLLKGAKAGDRLVFHFSGHGSYTRDNDDDEQDGVDELLCLSDMQWSDRDSYLLDDDLRKMTEAIPQGVHVTFLLDSCHSGTGTRALQIPGFADDIQQDSKNPVIDVETTMARLAAQITPRAGASPFEAGTAFARGVAPQTAADAEKTVLARFVPPPPEVAQRFRTAGVRRPMSAMGDDSMNHVLFSGSRSDQTSADAYIDGDYHGAFSYYFCQSARDGHVQRQQLVRTIREKLQQQHFSQVPQLEPVGTEGPLFGGDSESGTDDSAFPPPDEASHTTLQTLLQQIIELLQGRGASASGVRDTTAPRQLVYVHGICRHDPGYSDDWWASLRTHLAPQLRQQLKNNRHEVLWSDIVTPIRAARDFTDLEADPQESTLSDAIRAILEDRADRQIVEQAPAQSRSAEPVAATTVGDRALLGIPGLNCVDDFAKYLSRNSIRDRVLDRFLNVVESALAQGATLDIISHSWGTVVAYEGLRRLDGSGLAGFVRNWFTVGSALSIGPVRRRLLWRDGRRPAYVRQWINLDAKGDIVGGALRTHGFAVDSEFLGLRATGCGSFAGIVSPSCAHSSYFHADNRAVNRGIFARQMDH